MDGGEGVHDGQELYSDTLCQGEDGERGSGGRAINIVSQASKLIAVAPCFSRKTPSAYPREAHTQA